MRALVVADPLMNQQRLVDHLRSRGHQAEYAGTGEDAMDLIRRYEFDVVLVGLSLPDMRGTDLIRCLRGSHVDTPVLALSPTPYAPPRIAALAAGADDVMATPYDKAELYARLQALVRRSHGHSQQVLNAGPVSINLATHEVTVNGRALSLTRKETAVLELLVLRCNSPVAKETFLNQLYASADQEPDSKIVDVFVCKIRGKLARAGAPHLIETVWGRGYMVRSTRQKHDTAAKPFGASAPVGPVSEMA